MRTSICQWPQQTISCGVRALAAVDALTLLKDKVGSIPELQILVAKAATLLTDFLTVYSTFQTNLGKL